MADPKSKKIIIEGTTEEGQVFRPSDWSERMSGSMCSFDGHRMRYSPLLQPVVKNGQKCLLIDPDLKETNSALYDAIMDFAKNNKLIMHSEDNSENNPETDQ